MLVAEHDGFKRRARQAFCPRIDGAEPLFVGRTERTPDIGKRNVHDPAVLDDPYAHVLDLRGGADQFGNIRPFRVIDRGVINIADASGRERR
ncbi:MAG TPA: hypothetical protein VIY09_03490 [Rhizomicrobium sp.]